MSKTRLELLSPARTADIGIEAVRHGADAVYIGAPQFGARQAAGNSVDDIRRLVDFAHPFGCRIYVTVNTILYDHELAAVERLIGQLYDIGVDALIVQDTALLRMQLPPIPLHASTQMNNVSADRVRFLAAQGFEQVVLARELSLDEIRDIHRQCPDVRLEVFVHGALCVSLSGQCYASEALFSRSANRGACAQVCRMEFDLEDELGTKYLRRKHLLSLRDLCQIDVLGELAEAGATSFKIEGRLKDMDYVKNVTAAYSEALDRLVAQYPDRYVRASHGQVELAFRPDVRKSFNRGFTHYFLHGRNADIFSFDTPKAVGEPVGRVRQVFTDSVVVDGRTVFSNGDGLCFFDAEGRFCGFRVNRAEGQRLYFGRQNDVPLRQLRGGLPLYRNFDKAFQDLLGGPSATRFLPVDITLDSDGRTFALTITDGLRTASIRESFEAELARTHQRENIERQLGRLGNTEFRLRSLHVRYSKNYFIPSSLLSDWRKRLVAALREASGKPLPLPRPQVRSSVPATLTYLSNVSNALARDFYAGLGARHIDPAFELQHRHDVPVMFCRHCIRYALGWCYKHEQPQSHAPRQLFLRLANGTRFRLEFDCRACMMKVCL